MAGMREDPYAARAKKRVKVNYGAVEGQRRPGRAAAQNRSDMLGLGAALAPAAGSVIGGIAGGLAGGPAGIPIGAGIGGGVGSLAGAGLGFAADKQTEPYDEEEAKRQARYAAVARFLGV